MALPTITGEYIVVSKEPDLRFLTDGTPILTIAVATKSRKRVNDQWVDDKNFITDVEFWREEAEQLAPLLPQFTIVVISGEMRVDEWDDKNGGGKRRKTVIQKASLGIKPPRPQQGQQGGQQGGQQNGYQQGQQGQQNQQGYNNQQQGQQGGYGQQGGAQQGQQQQGQQGYGQQQQGQQQQQLDPWGQPIGSDQPPF